MPTLFEHAGGERALHRLEAAFYDSVLRDPILQPLFGAGRPEHVEHLIAVHRGLHITEQQRRRFVELYMAAMDAVGMPDDEPFRRAVREHVDFGSRVALQNSNAETDGDLHPLREVP